MNRDEQHACKFLATVGLGTPVFEPDGNIPPDFSLDGRIAIEVRRLNENERDCSNPRGLDEVAVPITRKLHELLKTFGASDGLAWWVVLRFRRPVPHWQKLKRRIKDVLLQVELHASLEYTVIDLEESVRLELIPHFNTGVDKFHLALCSDEDSGGWLIENLEWNLRLAIAEKTTKTAPYRSQYQEWWLVLVDYVAFGLNATDHGKLMSTVTLPQEWDRIVLIDPQNHTRHFDL